MARSLSDLIYNSRNSAPSPGRGQETRKTNNTSSLTEIYKYDPIDDFYQSQSSSHVGTDERAGGDGDDTNTVVKNNQTEKKYDFQLKSEDRDFYHSSLTTSPTQSGKTVGAKKRNWRYDEETKEEYLERKRKGDIVKARRKRFKSKKYNFEDEIDHGGSIARMIQLQMDVNGNKIDSTRKRKGHGDINEGHESDSDSDGDDSNSKEHIEDKTKKRERYVDDSVESEAQSYRTNQNQHVLGSLLDRIQKQEDMASLQQVQSEQAPDDVEFKSNTDLMHHNPMAFLQHGYLAPLQVDPNIKQFSYMSASSKSKLSAVRANELFYKEKLRSRKFHKRPSNLDASSSHPIESEVKNVETHRQLKVLSRNSGAKFKVSSNNGMILSHFLPINCHNPTVSRLRYPEILDTYHYLPYSRQDPTSLRMNTTKDDFVDNLFSPYDETRQFYKKYSKSFYPLHFHSRNIQLFAARLVVCCAGLLHNHSNSDNGAVNSISRVFEMLYRKKNTSSRMLRTIRVSQEVASNYAMWLCLQHRIERLLSRQRLDVADYHFLKKELLSDQSQILCDPFTTSDSKDLKDSALRKRRTILKFLSSIDKEERNFLIESLDESDGENDEANEGDNFNRVKSQLDPSRPMFCCAYAKKIERISDVLSMSRGEKFSQVIHTSELDLDTIRLTLATLYSELSLQRSKKFAKKTATKKKEIGDNKEAAIHESILSYLEKITSETWFIRNNTKGSGFFDKNMLNGPLAQTILMRQSYVANSGFACESPDYRAISQEVYSIGSSLHGDDKLTIFSQIHKTT